MKARIVKILGKAPLVGPSSARLAGEGGPGGHGAIQPMGRAALVSSAALASAPLRHTIALPASRWRPVQSALAIGGQCEGGGSPVCRTRSQGRLAGPPGRPGAAEAAYAFPAAPRSKPEGGRLCVRETAEVEREGKRGRERKREREREGGERERERESLTASQAGEDSQTDDPEHTVVSSILTDPISGEITSEPSSDGSSDDSDDDSDHDSDDG